MLTAITDVELFDGRQGTTQPGTTVLFDERVRAVGPAGSVDVESADHTVDGRRRTLLPGLIDAHVHLTGTSAKALLAQGVTAVRDVGNDLAMVDGLRSRLGTAGPAIRRCGPLIDGPRPMWPSISVAVTDRASAQRAVDDLAAAGVDGIKTYAYLAGDPLRAVIERAHEHRLTVTAHLGDTPASEAVAWGLDGVEHAAQGLYHDLVAEDRRLAAADRDRLGLGRFWAQVAAGWAATDPTSSRSAQRLARLAGHGAYLTPTLVAFASMLDRQTSDTPAAPSGVTAEDDSTGRLTEGWSDGDYDVAATALDVLLSAVGEFHRAGGQLLCGTDGLGTIQRELGLLVKAGLTPAQALLTATGPCGGRVGDHDWGVVRVGGHADLLLVDGYPADDIGAVDGVAAVYRDGELVAGVFRDRVGP